MILPDFFSFYSLPQCFHTDAALLRKQYYAMSRKYHPDLVSGEHEEAKVEALLMSSLNNQAFQTLKDEDATMGYILRLNGVLETDEAYKLPPDFLMEMMELNEALEEQSEVANAAMDKAFSEWEQEVKPLMQRFDSGDHAQELLLQIKDYYFRKKYLNRLRGHGNMD